MLKLSDCNFLPVLEPAIFFHLCQTLMVVGLALYGPQPATLANQLFGFLFTCRIWTPQLPLILIYTVGSKLLQFLFIT